MKAELDRYKKMAGGRLAAGANMLGELYADELLESQMDEISKDIQKTFKDSLAAWKSSFTCRRPMNDVQAIFSKKALREGLSLETEVLPEPILRDPGTPRRQVRISFADELPS
eukprot:g21169.t1